jgi:cytochrome c-type biogenesis protein CcmH/NrfG
MLALWMGLAVLLIIACVWIFWSLPRQWRLLKYSCVLVLAVGVTFAYLYLWGDHRSVFQWHAMQQQRELIDDYLTQYDTPDKIIAQLTARLQQDPDSHQGWFLLGRLYVGQQRYADAMQAFTRAQRLQPEHVETVFQLAQTDYLLHDGDLSAAGERYLAQLLAADAADYPPALNLAAAVAYQRQAYAQAIEYWQRLLNFYPPGDEQATILQAIAQAKQQLAAQ